MKAIFFSAVLLLLFAGAGFIPKSQKLLNSGTTTIIILRHAEKDTAGGDDPILSVAGMQRAERLPAVFENVSPDAFYSTDYIRTRETLTPWAKRSLKEIEVYDPKNLPAFSDMLMQEKEKTIVVAGHSNTVPVLVNLLIAEEKYKALPDTEYLKIFVVTIKNGKAKEKIMKW